MMKCLNKKIKVIHITEPTHGGVKRYLIDLLYNIDINKFDITFIYSRIRTEHWFDKELEHIKERGIKCIEIPMRREIRPIADLKALFAITTQLIMLKPNIVHAHSSKAGVLGRCAAIFTMRDIKVIYTPHGMAFYERRWSKYVEKILSPLTDILIAVSPSEGHDILSEGIIVSKKLRVIAPSYKDMLKTGYSTNSHSMLTITACGRICYVKNSLLFFKAACFVLKKIKNVKFIWIGDFTEQDEESNQVKAFLSENTEAKNIEITGWIESPNLYIEQSDIFLALSRHESFGYATIDAMMLEKAIIATKVTGNIDLIKNYITGILVDQNVESVALAIIKLINDETLRLAIGKQAKAYAEKEYSMKKMINRLHTLYEEIISS